VHCHLQLHTLAHIFASAEYCSGEGCATDCTGSNCGRTSPPPTDPGPALLVGRFRFVSTWVPLMVMAPVFFRPPQHCSTSPNVAIRMHVLLGVRSYNSHHLIMCPATYNTHSHTSLHLQGIVTAKAVPPIALPQAVPKVAERVFAVVRHPAPRSRPCIVSGSFQICFHNPGGGIDGFWHIILRFWHIFRF
jgi:hypothetical protein